MSSPLTSAYVCAPFVCSLLALGCGGGTTTTSPAGAGLDAAASLDAGGDALQSAADAQGEAATPQQDAGSGTDPFSMPPTCTSGTTWTNGNTGSAQMQPGTACNACHKTSAAPIFTIAGTVYPTGHEPDNCSGTDAGGIQVVITDADGGVTTYAVNSAGNFYGRNAIATPYMAKVVSSNGERAASTPQTSGDCNACHTQAGANGAPGRIVAP